MFTDSKLNNLYTFKKKVKHIWFSTIIEYTICYDDTEIATITNIPEIVMEEIVNLFNRSYCMGKMDLFNTLDFEGLLSKELSPEDKKKILRTCL